MVPVALRVAAVANEPGVGGAGETALHAPQPNPVAGRSTLRYDVAEGGFVRLSVLDLLGREVAVLADGTQAAGRHEATLDGAAFTPGVYVVRLHASDGVQVQRVTVVR